MQEERIVIVAYKPLEGKAEKLMELLQCHVDILRKEGLATDRDPILICGKEGIIVEIFEWKSKQAIEEAHFNPVIQKLWQELADTCQYIPIAEVDEAQHLFSEFSPI